MDSLRYAGEYNAPEIRQVAIDFILAHFDDMETAFAAAPREERIELATEVIADMPTIRSFLTG